MCMFVCSVFRRGIGANGVRNRGERSKNMGGGRIRDFLWVVTPLYSNLQTDLPNRTEIMLRVVLNTSVILS